MGRYASRGLQGLRMALRLSEEFQVRALSLTQMGGRLLYFIETSHEDPDEESAWMEVLEDGLWSLKDGTPFEKG
jgi:hypothetical protein